MNQTYEHAISEFVDARCEHSLEDYHQHTGSYQQRLSRLTELGQQVKHLIHTTYGKNCPPLDEQLNEYMELANSLAFEECTVCYRQGYQDALQQGLEQA